MQQISSHSQVLQALKRFSHPASSSGLTAYHSRKQSSGCRIQSTHVIIEAIVPSLQSCWIHALVYEQCRGSVLLLEWLAKHPSSRMFLTSRPCFRLPWRIPCGESVSLSIIFQYCTEFHSHGSTANWLANNPRSKGSSVAKRLDHSKKETVATRNPATVLSWR